jgi:hypothetical protein
MNRTRRIVGNILISLSGLLLVASAAAKFAGVPKVVSELSSMGFDGNRLLFVAVLEIFSAVLFLVPFTRPVGLLLVCSYLGGAIATHLQHGRSIVQPIVVLAVVWCGTLLRYRRPLWTVALSEEQVERSLASSEG